MSNYSYENEAAHATDEGEGTLTRKIYERLREAITSGELKPGDRLVRRALSKKLGVSPMPITEALLRLEMDGLVENRPLFGARVQPLTLDDVRNDNMLREAIECQSARLCAERASDEDLDRLGELADTLDKVMLEGEPLREDRLQLHIDFHLGVAQATGFPRLGDALQRVWFRRLMRLYWVNASAYTPVQSDHHRRVVEGLRTRDPDVAERAMREHVRYGRETDEKALNDVLEGCAWVTD